MILNSIWNIAYLNAILKLSKCSKNYRFIVDASEDKRSNFSESRLSQQSIILF